MPIYSRYFFEKRKDIEFISETAFIHQNYFMLIIDIRIKTIDMG